MMITCSLGITYDVPGDEEIRRKAKLIDDFEFAFPSFVCLFIIGALSSRASFACELDEQLIIISFGSGEDLPVV